MINALKLEYCFQMSSDEESVTMQKVEDYIIRCLQAYGSIRRPDQNSESAIESQPSDDLCLLAAMSLIRFNGVGSQDRKSVV